MPKTTSPTLLAHYPPLRDISSEDWDEVFDRDREQWTPDEDAYVCQWYGKEHIVDIAYALGRVPWKVGERANKLGVRIGPRGRYPKLAEV